MKTKLTILLLWLFVVSPSFGQTSQGLSFDNYNGIYNIATNPAFSVESKSKWHINGLSYSSLNFTAIGVNDALSLEYNKSPNGFNAISFEENNTSNENLHNAFTEQDWLLPSVIFKPTERLAFGLLLRARQLTNYSNFSGKFWQGLNAKTGFENTGPIQNDPHTFVNTSHSWSEVGLNISYTLVNSDKHLIKIGGTAKLLLGQGVVNIRGDNFSISKTQENPNQVTISADSLKYLNTYENPFNSNADIITQIDENNIFAGPFNSFFNSTSTSGNLGGDAGLVWEYRPSTTNRLDRGVSEAAVNLYKLKVAAAIVDLGSITYETNPNTDGAIVNDTYQISQLPLATSDFPDENLIAVLREETGEEVNRSQPRGEVKVSLPTAVNVNVDYLFSANQNIYINVNYMHPIRKNTDAFSNQRNQMVTVTPRMENPNWSFYLPLSYGVDSGFAGGIGGRFKFITAGLSVSNFVNEGGLNYLFIGINQTLFKL
ncbi:hypothetical protein GCM10011414_07230 [Croceivirga lutea]|uniref:DUF5723 family protein n=1 Tax=Croceivirga lutea TaxID=1775167 RepID=UPI00163A2886|nr:DUF5723 family protein [Croceivirga lutea]GGG40271.1 hypothetical protein GCM10011414_07230 [Croceivirga lutea]